MRFLAVVFCHHLYLLICSVCIERTVFFAAGKEFFDVQGYFLDCHVPGTGFFSTDCWLL